MVLHVKLPDNHLDQEIPGCREARDGPDCHHVGARAQPAHRIRNSSYDRQSGELKTLSANILLLDRTLKFYGPDAKEARDGLRDAIRQTHDRIWSPAGVRPKNLKLEGDTKLRERQYRAAPEALA